MILLLNCGSSKTPLIQELIQCNYPCKTIPFLDFNEEDILQSDAVILSGAPILLSEIDYSRYVQRMEWLATYSKPVLGICFGHQLIGLYFGAGIARQQEDRELQLIEVLESNPLFKNLDTEFEMMEDHCESISIPPHFVLAATSDKTVNEAMHHKSRLIFGVQFHPEVSGENGEILLHNFTKLVQENRQSATE
jgi:GMP synthase (glutamine-hydrolysing)